MLRFVQWLRIAAPAADFFPSYRRRPVSRLARVGEDGCRPTPAWRGNTDSGSL